MFLGVPSLDLLKDWNAPYNEPESFQNNPPCFPQEKTPFLPAAHCPSFNHSCGRIA